MTCRSWAWVLVVAMALAWVSLASNITTGSQLFGEADIALAVRSTVGKVVNAGTVWAGLAVFSGWLVRRPLGAVVAGIVSLSVAIGVHYSTGLLLGMFDSDVWADNAQWLGAVVLGGLLGWVGAMGRRADLWGLVSRLVVPVGAVVEPFVRHMFTNPAFMPWPNRVSSVVAGVLLIAGGLVGGIAVLVVSRAKGVSAPALSVYQASPPGGWRPRIGQLQQQLHPGDTVDRQRQVDPDV
ncbi:hypothetical protein [Rhodococcus sp. 27YEA15]|uniref:hypothetical protein n=1 Tax=Rhodococcus sp. 27YEA15 TaxID=3156259 RepID=UPI003C7C7086